MRNFINLLAFRLLATPSFSHFYIREIQKKIDSGLSCDMIDLFSFSEQNLELSYASQDINIQIPTVK